MTNRERPGGLLGRRSECETLDRLLRSVRSGQSRVLVLRGEAGQKDPRVRVKVGRREYSGTARLLPDDDPRRLRWLRRPVNDLLLLAVRIQQLTIRVDLDLDRESQGEGGAAGSRQRPRRRWSDEPVASTDQGIARQAAAPAAD